MPPRRDRIQVRQNEDLSPQRFRPAASPENAVATPQARPLDTFVRPADTQNHQAGRQMAQLASALSGLAPSLSRFASQRMQKENDEKYDEGKTRALELQRQGVSYKQAIERGLIDRKDSPFFRAGLQEQMGAAAAGRFDDYLKGAMDADETLRESTDPADFDAFVSRVRAEWEEANVGTLDKKAGQYFTLGYNARAQAHVESRRGEFVADMGRKMEAQSISSHFDNVLKTVKDEIGKVPADQLAESINTLNADLIAQGRDPMQVYRTTMRAIREAAIRGESKDAALLLEKVAGRDGIVLANMGHQESEEFRQTLGAVVKARNEREMAERTQRQREEDDLVDEVYAEAARFALDNPNASLQPFVDRVIHIGGAGDKINNIRSTVHNTLQYDDERVVRRLFTSIWGEGTATVRSIMQEYDNGGVTLATANQMIGVLRGKQSMERQDAAAERAASAAERQADAAGRRAYRDVMTDPIFTNELSNVSGRFSTPNGILGGEARERIAHAEATLRARWMEWRMGAGAEKSSTEASNWLKDEATAIVNASRRGLFGYSPDGTPKSFGSRSAAPSESTGAAPKPQQEAQSAKPEITAAELLLLQQVQRNLSPRIPPSLQAKLDSIGNTGGWPAINTFITQQASLLGQPGSASR